MPLADHADPAIARGSYGGGVLSQGRAVKSVTVFQWTGADGRSTVLNTYAAIIWPMTSLYRKKTSLRSSIAGLPAGGPEQGVKGLISILKEFSKTPNMLFMYGWITRGRKKPLPGDPKINACSGVTAVHSTCRSTQTQCGPTMRKRRSHGHVQGELRHCQAIYWKAPVDQSRCEDHQQRIEDCSRSGWSRLRLSAGCWARSIPHRSLWRHGNIFCRTMRMTAWPAAAPTHLSQ